MSAAVDRIRVVCGGAKLLFSGPVEGGAYDLIYSAGLFDYLADPVAQQLVSAMLSQLRPAGRLLLGNFARGSFGRGFMSSLLNWHLKYRAPTELESLVLGTIGSTWPMQSFLDPHDNVAYLQITRPTE